MTQSVPDSSESPMTVRAVFRAWERLRPAYVGALAAVFLVAASLVLGVLWLHPFFLIEWVVAAVAANVCYFAGPVLEAYLHWLGFRAAWIRMPLFLAGTLFAALLTVFTVLIVAANPPIPAAS